MPKIIPSPTKRWPGTITLPDALTYPQYLAWRNSLATVVELSGPNPVPIGDLAANERLVTAMLPGVCACVSRWELGGSFPVSVTPHTFPATPRTASFALLVTLIEAINQLVTETDELPNA